MSQSPTRCKTMGRFQTQLYRRLATAVGSWTSINRTDSLGGKVVTESGIWIAEVDRVEQVFLKEKLG